MGGIGDLFSGLSWIYLLGAGYTLVQLKRGWGEFWDRRVTSADRSLAGSVAFFLLVPVGVLLHEVGHMLAAWSTGSRVLGLHYFLYWGYVSYVPASDSALLSWYVALAGNFVSYALGIACVAAALLVRPLPSIGRVTLIQLGVLELVQTLIFYPLLSLDPAFEGDWDSIYSFRAPVASSLTLLVHIVSLVAFVVLLRRNRAANFLLQGTSAPQSAGK